MSNRVFRDSARYDIGVRRKLPPDEKGGIVWQTFTDQYDVAVEIDVGRLMQFLGAKAARAKTKRSRALNGIITVKAKAVA